MKKKLNKATIMNELQGESSFFPYEEEPPVNEAPLSLPARNEETSAETQERQRTDQEPVVSRHHDTVIPPHQDELVESIRKAVKGLGKEAATYRFTQEEKRTLSNIVFEYKNKGIRTSENEITRIAINFLIEEFQLYGKQSILARVLDRLNS